MLVFDELYPENATVVEIVAAIKERNARWGISNPHYLIDPSATQPRAGDRESRRSPRSTGRASTRLPAQNERDAGINQLRARC